MKTRLFSEDYDLLEIRVRFDNLGDMLSVKNFVKGHLNGVSKKTTDAHIKELVKDGSISSLIRAIKYYQAMTGSSLIESKKHCQNILNGVQ